MMTEELIVAIIIRKDLGMSCGKIGVQCAHGLSTIFMNYEEAGVMIRTLNDWYFNHDQKKIVLKVQDKSNLHAIESEFEYNEIAFEQIYDLGLTQLDGETLTGICTYPVEKSIVEPFIKGLKLL